MNRYFLIILVNNNSGCNLKQLTLTHIRIFLIAPQIYCYRNSLAKPLPVDSFLPACALNLNLSLISDLHLISLLSQYSLPIVLRSLLDLPRSPSVLFRAFRRSVSPGVRHAASGERAQMLTPDP